MPRVKGWSFRPTTGLIARIGAQCWEKEVEDGHLRILRSKDDGMWHLSISHHTADGQPGRYPSWDEITEARYGFLPDKAYMAMILPPKEEYVNVHETTFHLWELPQ